MSALPELSQYLSDPCGTLSLPYYKARDLTPPPRPGDGSDRGPAGTAGASGQLRHGLWRERQPHRP